MGRWERSGGMEIPSGGKVMRAKLRSKDWKLCCGDCAQRKYSGAAYRLYNSKCQVCIKEFQAFVTRTRRLETTLY